MLILWVTSLSEEDVVDVNIVGYEFISEEDVVDVNIVGYEFMSEEDVVDVNIVGLRVYIRRGCCRC